MCVDIDDPFEVFHDATRRARKPHHCCECGRDIGIGDQYWWSTGLFDGHWSTYHQCLHCVAAAEWLLQVCRGYLFEGILEDLEEHISENAFPIRTLSLWRLAYWMRRDWRKDDGTLVPIEEVRRWVKSGVAHATGRVAA